MIPFSPRAFVIIPTLECGAERLDNGWELWKKERCPGRLGSLAFYDRLYLPVVPEKLEKLAPEGKFTVVLSGGEPMLAGGENDFLDFFSGLRRRFGLRASSVMRTNLLGYTERMDYVFREFGVRLETGSGAYGDCEVPLSAEKELIRLSRDDTIETLTRAQSPFADTDMLGESRPFCACARFAPCRLEPERRTAAAEKIYHDLSLYIKRDIYHSAASPFAPMARLCAGKPDKTRCTFSDCLGSVAAVAPDGEIYACPRFLLEGKDFSLGSIFDSPSLEDIEKSAGWQKLNAAREARNAACSACGHFEYCRGGCLYNACLSTDGRDPFCPAYAQVFDTLCRGQKQERDEKSFPPLYLAMAGEGLHPAEAQNIRRELNRAARSGCGAEKKDELRREKRQPGLGTMWLRLPPDCPEERLEQAAAFAGGAGLCELVLSWEQLKAQPRQKELLGRLTYPRRQTAKAPALVLSYENEAPPEDAAVYFDELRPRGFDCPHKKAPDMLEHVRPRFSCPRGYCLYVLENGDAFPCMETGGFPVGNIYTAAPEGFMEREEISAFRYHDVDTNEKCRECALRYLCGGVCRGGVEDEYQLDDADFDCSERRSRLESMARLAEKYESLRDEADERWRFGLYAEDDGGV